MNKIKKRVIKEAKLLIETQKTIREVAKIFGVSKSTVHQDLHNRLIDIDSTMYKQIEEIMQHHIDIRHIKGGQSTKKKYEKVLKKPKINYQL